MLKTGIVVLYETVNSDLYNHFLTLCTAVRMISCNKTYVSKVDLSEKLLKNFVENFGPLYGHNKISFNVHNLLHVCDGVRLFGPLDRFSAYKFENYMRHISKQIHRPSQILQQLVKRTNEELEFKQCR